MYLLPMKKCRSAFISLLGLKSDAQTVTREGVLPLSEECDSSTILLAANGASVISGSVDENLIGLIPG